ncbi:MAG: amidophosphoribosyltransferase [Lentisphaerae bacterium RIFOXYC12_FULL_60_16]|nr:MAG: amidophosphoribosyltransferase [Lentisphaerae bacterium RIFOXYC12_FULL_60_16]OGV72910.1 MAG: amidophosphoribosyltransferase [Lentisphaerae bacterium RIFOXYA12_FULL_60_10]OGV78469.1 MAG: amidophosphoribosyltransferase [Lentisphaerae bacterium RIFOXYB12_FULL_60_10]
MNSGILDDHPLEHCGLFGVYGVPAAAPLIFTGLFALQHRGQEGAGIVVSDGTQVSSAKGLGLVSEVFAGRPWDTLPGSIGIGHVRYSTTGASRVQNVQPLVVECVDGIWAVAHNGNLVNAARLRRMYQEAGAIFQTSTDSEVLVHLLADPMFRTRPGRVGRALGELKGAYSFLLMTRDCLMAARDPMGFRPLSIGRIGGAWVVASETCALRQTGAEFVRDVEPGELVIIDAGGLHSTRFADARAGHLSQCVFEVVYFARPDSRVFGSNVHQVRLQYGMRLAEEHPVDADIVIAVPDSGNSAALGYSRKSGIPMDFGFIRNHYVGRTFIMPQTDARSQGVDIKLSVLSEVVDGKRVVVVDDSIVRGTTAQRRVSSLRDAGAREIHMRISSPPTIHPCHFGIDFATEKELAAAQRGIDEIRTFIGADSLGYLSVDGLLSPFACRGNFCTACFTGDYRIPVDEASGKLGLETGQLSFGDLPVRKGTV